MKLLISFLFFGFFLILILANHRNSIKKLRLKTKSLHNQIIKSNDSICELQKNQETVKAIIKKISFYFELDMAILDLEDKEVLTDLLKQISKL